MPDLLSQRPFKGLDETGAGSLAALTGVSTRYLLLFYYARRTLMGWDSLNRNCFLAVRAETGSNTEPSRVRAARSESTGGAQTRASKGAGEIIELNRTTVARQEQGHR